MRSPPRALRPARAGPAAAAQQRCIDTLTATANADGSITLAWTSLPNVTGYQVIVGVGGSFTPLTPQVPPSATTFTYTGSTPGTTSTFAVVAMNSGTGQQVGNYCQVEVTSVPFFPGVLGLALAGLGGVACYALLRRT
ncbi:MAG: hypothetical protein LC624_05530 [Halobacteriales archaeon]|nr:hypothetical protein [Halobacteriales archaeon]